MTDAEGESALRDGVAFAKSLSAGGVASAWRTATTARSRSSISLTLASVFIALVSCSIA